MLINSLSQTQYERGAIMREIDFSEFKRMKVTPNNKNVLAFSIMLDGTMRINSKLYKKRTTDYINVFSIPDGTIVAIKYVESDAPDACRVGTDGNAKVPALKEDLEAANIKLPARYIAEWCEKHEFWQAEINERYSFRPAKKKSTREKTNKALRG